MRMCENLSWISSFFDYSQKTTCQVALQSREFVVLAGNFTKRHGASALEVVSLEFEKLNVIRHKVGPLRDHWRALGISRHSKVDTPDKIVVAPSC